MAMKNMDTSLVDCDMVQPCSPIRPLLRLARIYDHARRHSRHSREMRHMLVIAKKEKWTMVFSL